MSIATPFARSNSALEKVKQQFRTWRRTKTDSSLIEICKSFWRQRR